MALRRLLWSPNELGITRAYVSGELEIEGSIFDLFALAICWSRADLTQTST